MDKERVWLTCCVQPFDLCESTRARKVGQPGTEVMEKHLLSSQGKTPNLNTSIQLMKFKLYISKL